LNGDAKTNKLLDMLVQGDDSHLPSFIEALRQTGQNHVVKMLGFAGELSTTD